MELGRGGNEGGSREEGKEGAEERGIEEEVRGKINEGRPGDGVGERKEWSSRRGIGKESVGVEVGTDGR